MKSSIHDHRLHPDPPGYPRPLRDKDIREPLFDHLEERYGRIRILEEKTMGRARADIVMITEKELVGIEIKSDADSYARLGRQVRAYDLYYDRILVVGSTHAAHVREHVPEHWGIISVERADTWDFYVIREPAVNPHVDDRKKITILWRPELDRLLSKNGLPKYAQKSKRFVQEKLLGRVSPGVLWPQACEELFQRDYDMVFH